MSTVQAHLLQASISDEADHTDTEAHKSLIPAPRIRRKPVAGLADLDDVQRRQNKKAPLPPYDKAYGMRNICIAGLFFSWALAIVCMALVPWTFQTNQIFVTPAGAYSMYGISFVVDSFIRTMTFVYFH